MNDFNAPQSTGGFDFNRPTIISLLYLGSFVAGITGIIGVVLAFVWRGEPHADWESSHYTYLVNTFWVGLAGAILGMLTMLVGIGILIMGATVVLVIVRSVLCIIQAQKHLPMPKPDTWLA